MAASSHLLFHAQTLTPAPSLSSCRPPPLAHLAACRRRLLPVGTSRLLHLRPAAAGGGGVGPGGGGLADLGELLGRVEALVYTVADAAVSASSSPGAEAAVAEESAKKSDWLSGIANYMETVLKVLKDGLSTLHVPYAYGFAIILLTVLVKAATFPLTKKQVESALAMKALQPQVKAIQQRYAGDQERIQLETARLYKLAGVNPLAGCLPTLATIPVWIGLYRALSNVADEGLLTEGFFWIPSLAGPTTIAARQSGGGISWLFPFKDGHPPLGWSDTLAYLVLPALLVISQYISAQIMQPPQSNDPSQKSAQAVTKFLPLLIGYFSLSVPSGLSLYWLTNNILSTAQQIWLQKLGGAKNPVKEYIDKVARDESSTIEKYVSDVKNLTPDPQPDKAKSSQEQTSGRVQRGERFKQIKEEEERKKKLKEEAKREHTEKDEQQSCEDQTKMDLSIYNNGGLSHSTGSTTGVTKTDGNAHKEEVADIRASLSKQIMHDTHNLREQETDRDGV